MWLCEACQYEHEAEDPPAFCPRCAGLRRNFARLGTDVESPAVTHGAKTGADDAVAYSPARNPPRPTDDGYLPLAKLADVPSDAGLAVEIAGREIALFRLGDGHSEEVLAIDNVCPHQGAPLAQGQCENGVVTCPWHQWTFDGRSGACLEGGGPGVRNYPVKLRDGQVCVRVSDSSDAAGSAAEAPSVDAPLGVHSACNRGSGDG